MERKHAVFGHVGKGNPIKSRLNILGARVLGKVSTSIAGIPAFLRCFIASSSARSLSGSTSSTSEPEEEPSPYRGSGWMYPHFIKTIPRTFQITNESGPSTESKKTNITWTATFSSLFLRAHLWSFWGWSCTSWCFHIPNLLRRPWRQS